MELVSNASYGARVWKRAFLTLCVIVFGLGTYAIRGGHHPQKHTGRAQVASVAGPRYWFMRPNGEVFEMYFDNPPGVFQMGLLLDDITYTDDNSDMRHFVKATLPGRR